MQAQLDELRRQFETKLAEQAYSLDNWNGNDSQGNRSSFSEWEHQHRMKKWQLNEASGTLSPKGRPDLVLGFDQHSLLVAPTDPRRLEFDTSALRPCTLQEGRCVRC